jgi:hypothetical protein
MRCTRKRADLYMISRTRLKLARTDTLPAGGHRLHNLQHIRDRYAHTLEQNTCLTVNCICNARSDENPSEIRLARLAFPFTTRLTAPQRGHFTPSAQITPLI